MKLCKDCAYFIYKSLGDGRFSQCAYARQMPGNVEPIMGEPSLTFCQVLRQETYSDKLCGPDARFFVPRGPEPIEAEVVSSSVVEEPVRPLRKLLSKFTSPLGGPK